MTQKITFANQKGGVGKTSLTLHTSGALAEMNKKVLAIDMDQQGNLSSVFIDNNLVIKYLIQNSETMFNIQRLQQPDSR